MISKKKLLALLKNRRTDNGLDMSADNTQSILTIFLQVVLAILIPFVMIAITHKDKFKVFMEAVKKEFTVLEKKYKYLEGSNVKLEYDERKAKTEELQWLEILRALNEVEKAARDSLYLNLFVQAGEGGPSVIRPDLNVLSGTQVSNEYFGLSCSSAMKMLPYGRYATRAPAGLEQKWLRDTIKGAGLELMKDSGGNERNVTADELIFDPNALTTVNRGKLNKQVKQKVNLLYEDACTLQSRVLEQLRFYCRTHPVKGTKFFRTAEQFWKVSEDEQDGLLAKLLFELDDYTKSVLKKQDVELLPEVWQRSG